MTKTNTPNYPAQSGDRSRLDEQYQPFIARILTVDYERMVCTIKEDKSDLTYTDVRLFPAHYSSVEATDLVIPEEGAACLAVKVAYTGGYSTVAIITYLVSDTVSAIDTVAHRPIEGIQGWRERRRGSFRKAYPGQHTVTTTAGYSEKTEEGWDRLSSDFSRDHLDVNRRTRTQITSRQVQYTDAGLLFVGPVNRPNARTVRKVTLPDGSTQQVVFLSGTAIPENRYFDGADDVIAFSERTEKIQEFALDYAVPQEVLQDPLLDTILGTTALPWSQTTISDSKVIKVDNETFVVADQPWDHPYNRKLQAVGPASEEGPTPMRRGWIIERTEGTLVGSNQFDPTTYGLVLKPVIFPYTHDGRFGSDVESSYIPIFDDPAHVEAHVAASAWSLKFPHEHNSTRADITKEGFMTFEIGSTLPKERNPFNDEYEYEHPHGAGRSLEGNFVGSVKLVLGKNRDEEEALDLTALGQTVLRLGADDTSLPNDRHDTLYQQRSQSDKVLNRSLQFWTSPKLKPGDAVDLTNKVGAENVSLRAALDGAAIMRFGARNPNSKRRHLFNGYMDGPGAHAYAVSDPSRLDSKSSRVSYGAGDETYQFHDLTQAGSPQLGILPYNWSGQPVNNMDQQGLSIDFHAVRDILLRVGADEVNNQSLLLDLAGGIVAAIGKDTQGRSITATLDGGVEMTIGQNKQGKALRLEFNGDIDWTVKGNFHLNVTGDTVWESTTHRHNVKTDYIVTAQKIVEKGLARHTTESTDIVHNEGLYTSDENS